MPQFDFGYWPGQIFWLLVTFAVLYTLLTTWLLPRVRGTMDAREDRIAGDIQEARRLRDLAEADAKKAEAEMIDARASAHKTAADQKAKSGAESAQRKALLEAELSGKLAKAEIRIRASRDEAMSHVRGIAEDTASTIVEKLTGLPVSDADGLSAKA
jgi:F-type H+-transporting ATPase subunit b